MCTIRKLETAMKPCLLVVVLIFAWGSSLTAKDIISNDRAHEIINQRHVIINELISAFQDTEDRATKGWIVFALGELRAVSAIPLLIENIDFAINIAYIRLPEYPTSAKEALGTIGIPAVKPILEEMKLKNPDSVEALLLYRALAYVGGHELAIYLLEKELANTSSPGACSRLEKILAWAKGFADRVKEDQLKLKQAVDTLEKNLGNAPSQIHRAGAEEIIARLKEQDPEKLWKNRFNKEQISEKIVLDAIAKRDAIIDELIDAFQDIEDEETEETPIVPTEGDETKAHILYLLGELRAVDAIPLLIENIDFEVRAMMFDRLPYTFPGAKALEKIGVPAVKLILDAIKSNTDDKKIFYFYHALISIGGNELAIYFLEKEIANTASPEACSRLEKILAMVKEKIAKEKQSKID